MPIFRFLACFPSKELAPSTQESYLTRILFQIVLFIFPLRLCSWRPWFWSRTYALIPSTSLVPRSWFGVLGLFLISVQLLALVCIVLPGVLWEGKVWCFVFSWPRNDLMMTFMMIFAKMYMSMQRSYELVLSHCYCHSHSPCNACLLLRMLFSRTRHL
jgi:hypothetical protein